MRFFGVSLNGYSDDNYPIQLNYSIQLIQVTPTSKKVDKASVEKMIALRFRRLLQKYYKYVGFLEE